MVHRSYRECAALPFVLDDEGRMMVMLTGSRRTGRWALPRGWLLPGEPAYVAAAREAFDAAGPGGCIVEGAIGAYAHDKRLANGEALRCLVDVHPLAVEEQVEDRDHGPDRATMWIPPEAAARFVDDPGLAAIIASCAHRLTASPRLRLVGAEDHFPVDGRAGDMEGLAP